VAFTSSSYDLKAFKPLSSPSLPIKEEKISPLLILEVSEDEKLSKSAFTLSNSYLTLPLKSPKAVF
jgi:hypothetical protein